MRLISDAICLLFTQFDPRLELLNDAGIEGAAREQLLALPPSNQMWLTCLVIIHMIFHSWSSRHESLSCQIDWNCQASCSALLV